MKQLPMYDTEPEEDPTSPEPKIKRRGPRKEIVRIRILLQAAIACMFKSYPSWSAQRIQRHIGVSKLIRRIRKLYQVPKTINTIRTYTADVQPEYEDKVDRCLKLATHWYNLAISRVLRERKIAKDKKAEEAKVQQLAAQEKVGT